MTELHPATAILDDATVDCDAGSSAAPCGGDAPTAPATRPPRWQRNGWTMLCALLLVGILAIGYSAYANYRSTASEVASVRAAESDRAAAAKVAVDYATKSLTYSFHDPDAFFRAVEDGVAPTLKDKYANAHELLKNIMLQAQVTSTGEVLSTEVNAQPGGVFQVVVAATQTTRNLQNPEPRVSTAVLQITVNDAAGTWQVTDIGPKVVQPKIISKPDGVETPAPRGSTAVPPSPPHR